MAGGAPLVSRPFGFLPLHLRPCAICWFIYHAYFTASSAWRHWFTVLKKPRDAWDAMLNTFNILRRKQLSPTQQQTSDLRQLDNPNRTNPGSNARLPSYAPCQIVPSPPPPRSSLRAIYWRPSSWASFVPAGAQTMARAKSRTSAMKWLLRLVVLLSGVRGGASRWLSSGIGECCCSGGWSLTPFTFGTLSCRPLDTGFAKRQFCSGNVTAQTLKPH